MSQQCHQQLPATIIAGYANWGQCDQSLVQACQDGVNVLIWFSINLAFDEGAAAITGPATGSEFYDCVGRIVAQIAEQVTHPVVHLISIGGWNSPHPATQLSGREWWRFWKDWNSKVARPELGWHGFAGFDWDIEGNDDPASPINMFTFEELDLMGDMSLAAKADGFITALAPAQSYLDPLGGPEFSLSLKNAPVSGWQPGFKYHGRNTYAYLLAKCGSFTFDFISIQIYEGWSAANHKLSIEGIEPAAYIQALVKAAVEGWEVDFGPDSGLDPQLVSIDSAQLIIGLGNGWCSKPGPDTKFVLLWPEQVAQAWHALGEESRHRGFMFWTIGEEGATPAGTERKLWFTRELVDALGVN